MANSNVDTFQVTLSGVTTIDSANRGSSRVRVKNMNAAAGNVMYIGPTVNKAGSALSSTTGYPLAGQESVDLDLVFPTANSVNKELAVVGTDADKLAVLVLHP